MRSAIVSLANIASRLGNAELDNAILNAHQVAGLHDREMKVSHGSLAEEGFIPLQGQEPAPLGQMWGVPQTPTRAVSLLSTNGFLNRKTTHLPGPDDAHLTQPVDAEIDGQPCSYQTEQMSPRLGYGLWLEHPLIKLTSPPIDIFPYLNAKTTLSGVLFWSGLLWGLRILQATLGGDRAAADTAHLVFDSIVPVLPYRCVLDAIHARLLFRKQGYIEPDHPGYDPEGEVTIRVLMARASEARGTPIETFMRPVDIENTLRESLGQDYRIIEQALQGLGPSENVSMVHKFVGKLVRSSVCLGDGPRIKHDLMLRLIESSMNVSNSLKLQHDLERVS
ncbi:hypothetical protein S40293_09835 [Stachybotrys chartarum IBT 40293]|nr:hypothetical protein S40293_09835 [Stachybotrys chartarum IBT 40293]